MPALPALKERWTQHVGASALALVMPGKKRRVAGAGNAGADACLPAAPGVPGVQNGSDPCCGVIVDSPRVIFLYSARLTET